MESFSNGDYALILGVSSGFGAATARELAGRGCNIIGVHLDRAALMRGVEELRADLEDRGVSTHFFNVNAADADRRREVIDAIIDLRDGASDRFRLRLLLHTLASGTLRPLAARDGGTVSEAQLAMTLNVMASSLVFWTQDLVSNNLIGNGGRILAMTSSGAHRVLPHYGAVSAAKAALESFCRQLAFELGGEGITVNAIEAGVTNTPALRKIPGQEHLLASALARNPVGRLTQPTDVARIVRMLCSPSADWINGSTIRADGGEGIVELDWRDRDEG